MGQFSLLLLFEVCVVCIIHITAAAYTTVDSNSYLCMDSLRAIIATWLNTSYRRQLMLK